MGLSKQVLLLYPLLGKKPPVSHHQVCEDGVEQTAGESHFYFSDNSWPRSPLPLALERIVAAMPTTS